MALGLGRDAKGKMLAGIPLFAGLSKKELAQVASIAEELDYKAGKQLIREGRPGREFFIVLEGRVEVTRKGKHVATQKAGEFFGEIALVNSRPRTATVTTLEPSVMLIVSDTRFQRLLKTSPEIAVKVLQAFSDRLPPDEAS